MQNKKSALSQMANIVSNQVLAGDEPMTSDNIMRISNMMEDMTRGARTETGVRIDAPSWGGNSPDVIGITGTTGRTTTKVSDCTDYIEVIINIRNKLDDFLDGSNILLKVMNSQTIREMVREMRHEIRELKRDHGISELAIIEHLEKELDVETDNQSDWRTTTSYTKGRKTSRKDIGSYSEDVDIPF